MSLISLDPLKPKKPQVHTQTQRCRHTHACMNNKESRETKQSRARWNTHTHKKGRRLEACGRTASLWTHTHTHTHKATAHVPVHQREICFACAFARMRIGSTLKNKKTEERKKEERRRREERKKKKEENKQRSTDCVRARMIVCGGRKNRKGNNCSKQRASTRSGACCCLSCCCCCLSCCCCCLLWRASQHHARSRQVLEAEAWWCDGACAGPFPLGPG